MRPSTLTARVRITTSTIRISLHRHNLQVSQGIPCIVFEQRRHHSNRRVVPIRRATETAAENLLKRVRIMGGGDHHQHHGHGHGHGHGGHDDLSLLTSKDTSNPGVRITRIGLAVNLLLVVVKAIGGIISHSSSLLADAAHSAADILSDILTLSTITFSLREPNEQFPLGYGKVETLGGIGVSALLLLGGIGIGMSSLEALIATLPPNTFPVFLEQLIHMGHEHGHSHTHVSSSGADPIALWVSAGSIAVKEWLFRATKKAALQTNSTVLMANAWHHRTDALTSIVALVAIAGGQIYPFLDPVGGCLVSLLIIKVGYQSGKAACQEIVDRGLDADVLGDIRSGAQAGLTQALKTLPPTETGTLLSNVRGTKSGAYYIVDVEVEGAGNLTWDAFEIVRDGVEEGVKESMPSVKIVRVTLKTKKNSGQ